MDIHTPEVITDKSAFRIISMEVLEIGYGLAYQPLGNVSYTGLGEIAGKELLLFKLNLKFTYLS